MGAVPFQEAKWSAAGEPGDVADVAEQPGGAGRADAVELLQGAAGGVDEFGQLRCWRL